MNKCEEGRKEEMNKCEEGLALEKAKPERFFPFFSFFFSSREDRLFSLTKTVRLA